MSDKLELKDYNEALENVKAQIKKGTADEIKTAISNFKSEYETEFKDEIQNVQNELLSKLAEVQEHADKLDVKLQDKQKGEAKEAFIKTLVKENLEAIKTASKSKPFEFQHKDMTLGNALTGDQPRDYNYDVVRRSPQQINVEDLATSITISGGTYTYVRSTLASGAVAQQTEGALKAQLEYDYSMEDANTDYIAGFAVYSKKMRNNLPFLESTLSLDLRDDYYRGENSIFEAILAAEATASTEVITGQNKAEMIQAEFARLQGPGFNNIVNGIVMTSSDYYDILKIEVSTGAGYGLPIGWAFDNGMLMCMGVPVFIANWLPADEDYVGDWRRVRKVVTEGFSFTVSEDDSDNFRKNNITAKVEAQVTLTVEKPDALIYGDFTAV